MSDFLNYVTSLSATGIVHLSVLLFNFRRDLLMEIEKERSFRNVEMTTPDSNDTYIISYQVMVAETNIQGNT